MLRLKLETKNKKTKVTVEGDQFFSPRLIGTIEDKMLKVRKDLTANKHLKSKSLGIDRIVLENSEVLYNEIEMWWADERYITTRWYFYAHCKHYKVEQRDIDMLFLRTDLFGWKKAIDWERYIEHYQISQMDIFDVFKSTGYKDDNNKSLRKWEESMKLVEEYEDKNYRKVDL